MTAQTVPHASTNPETHEDDRALAKAAAGREHKAREFQRTLLELGRDLGEPHTYVATLVIEAARSLLRAEGVVDEEAFTSAVDVASRCVP